VATVATAGLLDQRDYRRAAIQRHSGFATRCAVDDKGDFMAATECPGRAALDTADLRIRIIRYRCPRISGVRQQGLSQHHRGLTRAQFERSLDLAVERNRVADTDRIGACIVGRAGLGQAELARCAINVELQGPCGTAAGTEDQLGGRRQHRYLVHREAANGWHRGLRLRAGDRQQASHHQKKCHAAGSNHHVQVPFGA